MTLRSTTPYTYNGDGVLVFDGTTRYTQDLAAPLTQVLQTTQGSATTDHLELKQYHGRSRGWGYDTEQRTPQPLTPVPKAHYSEVQNN